MSLRNVYSISSHGLTCKNQPNICTVHLQKVEVDRNVMKSITLHDETKVYKCSVWNKDVIFTVEVRIIPRTRSATGSLTVQMILIGVVGCQGLVHNESVPSGPKVIQQFYQTILWCLGEDLRKKQPELWCDRAGLITMTMYPCIQQILIHNGPSVHTAYCPVCLQQTFCRSRNQKLV